ncbi:hypothetical protein BISA_1419 [Bifidobacterium saguini DSM 23967]|uniref:Uncharacterized protein n=2 Tax=Bifidobacterium saguini TaxID=762210 RepID=A0A087DCT3_9BIFI|nr:hypothetical protein [Bifidobacterium saguini]KFI93333.1 hypothetical protein BISA_1419 [Bifidobacterium saguini DSM 23967]QTB90546.1 hypothetical protein BSD967_09540 [Bifidobacterium saguini]
MTAKYNREALVNRNYWALFSLLENFFSKQLRRYPALVYKYGDDAEQWALTFIFRNTREKMESLSYDTSSCNPKLAELFTSCSTDEEFEKNVLGSAKQWLVDLFDQTEFGRTRRVVEKDMEEHRETFAKVDKTNLWHLLACPSTRSQLSEKELRSSARRHKDLIKWPNDQKYDEFRQGKRSKMPPLARTPIVACLQDILQTARGSVEINVLTRLIVGLHPYMVQDGSDKNIFLVDDVDWNQENLLFGDLGTTGYTY